MIRLQISLLLVVMFLIFREADASPAILDVTHFGAEGDGKLTVNEDGDPINNAAFVRAWRKTCDSPGPAKMVVPPGKFVTSEVVFGGPCKNPNPIVEFQGTVIASRDFSTYYDQGWFVIQNVDGISITGTGTMEGEGVINWEIVDCLHNPRNCVHLPASLKIHGTPKSIGNSIPVFEIVNSHFKN